MSAMNIASPVLPAAAKAPAASTDSTASTANSNAESPAFSSVLQAKKAEGQSKENASNDTSSTSANQASNSASAVAETTVATPENQAAAATASILALLSATGAALAKTQGGSTQSNASALADDAKDDKKTSGTSELLDPLTAAILGNQNSSISQAQTSAPTTTQASTADTPAETTGGNNKANLGLLAANVAAKPVSESSAEENLATIASTKAADSPNANFEALLNSAQASQVNAHEQVTRANTTQHSELPLENRLGSSAWNEEVGNKLTWMVGNQNSRADLVLTPPELGRIEISMKISGNEASASFTSANPQVREALENAMPRLREVLADAGIALGQAQVGSNSSNQTPQDPKNSDNSRGQRNSETLGSASGIGIVASNSLPLRQGIGLVDTFA